MLEYGVTDDGELIDSLTQKIFGKSIDMAVAYIFYEKGLPIGIAQLKVTPDLSEIMLVGMLSEKRKMGFGNFFTRCLLLRLSEVSKKILVYKDDYFYQFGFGDEGEKMSIDSANIDFPSDCKKTEK